MKRLLPLIFLLISSQIELKAVSPIGGEVYYRHLKNLEYEVTIMAYRDCRGTPMGMMDLYISNDSFSVSTKTTRVKIEDISTYCPTKVCNPSNTTVSSQGIEVHYYLDTIDFNTGVFKKFISKNYCTVNFALYTCCRNGSILTLNSGSLYVDAMLNLCAAIKSPINTPRLLNKPQFLLSCNQTYSESYLSDGQLAGDSLGYELVKAQEWYKTDCSYYGSYTEKIPVVPYCTPVGSVNCVPNLSNLPVRGVNFNPKNGNFIVTPTNCAEVAVIAVQVNLYRKDSGKYKRIGYVKRDMMHVSYKTTINKPTLLTYRDYQIKARENTCIDIKIKDDTTAKNKDTVKVVIKKFPKYGQLSLLDSNAREKTLHYCWNVTDANYLDKLEDNLTLYAYDKACTSGQAIATTINFKAVAPDSITTINVKTFYDVNKNGKREAGEPYRSAPILFNRNGTLSFFNTDANGSLVQKPLYGSFKIEHRRNQFTFATNSINVFKGKFDSTYNIELGFNYSQGIKGRVFEDINNNCTYDVGTDVLLNGFKLMAKGQNAAAFTDGRGEFLFNSTVGNYSLEIDPNCAYQTSCINALSVLIKKDSQSAVYDFPVKKKTNFKDIKIVLKPAKHVRNNVSFTQELVVENIGNTNVSRFYIALLPSKKLQVFSSPFSNTTYNDTIFWLIDSMPKGSKKSIEAIHYITKANYKIDEVMNYKAWAMVNDSAMDNNYCELNEIVKDSGCCNYSEKRTYAPARYYPINKTITYNLNFIPTDLSKGAFVTDTIDDARFDLTTLKLLGTPISHTIYLNKNILYIDYQSNNFISSTNYTYSIELKKNIVDSFNVANTATAWFDNGPIQKSNTVVNTILSPIVYPDTTTTALCEDAWFTLAFNTNYNPEKNNRFKIYLSDSVGQFSQPSLLLDTLSNSLKNNFLIHAPEAYLSHRYQLKVMGTNPPTEAFSNLRLPSVTIHPKPRVLYTTNLKNGAICYGDTLKIQAQGAAEYWYYNYRKPGGTFSKTSDYSERLFNTANYEITFKSDKGCTAISPVISSGINFLPKVKLTSSVTKLCAGDALELQFSGASKYDLYLDGTNLLATGLISSPISQTPPVNQHFYRMVGTDLNGCKDSSNKVSVITHPLPNQPTVTRINRALKSNYTFGNEWLLNGFNIDSAKSQYFYPPFDAKFSVRHTDTNGCQSTSPEYNVNYTKLATLNKNTFITVYPNPAQNQLTIETLTGMNYNYRLYDSYGKLTMENKGQNMTSIDIAHLSSGNYVLCVELNQQVHYFKVSVLK